MLAKQLQVFDFRNHKRVTLELSPDVTVIWGPNGSGKTNLLEALYFGCIGRSCLGASERELVRFGAQVMRTEVTLDAADGIHKLSAAYQHGVGKKVMVDGVLAAQLIGGEQRPLISVFFPDRLELVKGPPALRRSHLDRFVGAIWPARTSVRQAYAQVLAQRNALLFKLRHQHNPNVKQLSAWNSRLASCAMALMASRKEAVNRLAHFFAERCNQLELWGKVELHYRPRSNATSAQNFIEELEQHFKSDLERGFSQYGPHRDELSFLRDDRSLRKYGSQGEQRLALLALLLAERAVLKEKRGVLPLLLLDDVMSELDSGRRARLVKLLEDGGQSVITTTETAHVPTSSELEFEWVHVNKGTVELVGA